MSKIQPIPSDPEIAEININGVVAVMKNKNNLKYPREVYIQIFATLMTIVFGIFIGTVFVLNIWEAFDGNFDKDFYQSCDNDGYMSADNLIKLQKTIDYKDKELYQLREPYLPFIDDDIAAYLSDKIENKTNALNQLYERCHSQLSLRDSCYNNILKTFFQKWHNIYENVLTSYLIISAIIYLILGTLIWTVKIDNLTKEQRRRLILCKFAFEFFTIVHLIFWSILIIFHFYHITEFKRTPPLLCGKWHFCVFNCDGIYRGEVESCFNDHICGCKAFYSFPFFLTFLYFVLSLLYIFTVLTWFWVLEEKK